MLEGLLVNLVPYGNSFLDRDHTWWNSESSFWGSMGDRILVSQADVDREHKEDAESEKPRTGVAFGIQTKDGQPLGYLGLNWIATHRRVGNLGAVIGEKAFWGGGYGTDALLLCVDYAFDWLDLRRVYLETIALNGRVTRQMEKVGFRLEAQHRRATFADGVWADVLVFGLMREEWPGRAAMIEKLGLQAR